MNSSTAIKEEEEGRKSNATYRNRLWWRLSSRPKRSYRRYTANRSVSRIGAHAFLSTWICGTFSLGDTLSPILICSSIAALLKHR